MINETKNESYVRKAKQEDFLKVNTFLKNMGLLMPIGEENIKAHWQKLWEKNPTVISSDFDIDLGWVIEKQGKIVGFFCNLPRIYFYGDQKIFVSVASQWGLEKQHRTKINYLAEAYFNQTKADLLIATTANKSAGKILTYHGAKKIPQYDYDKVLYWVINPDRFLFSVINNNLRYTGLRKLARGLMRPVPDIINFFKLNRPKSSKIKIDAIKIEDIDYSFDDLWMRKRAEKKCIFACRDAETLYWNFSYVNQKGQVRVLVHQTNRLLGYCVVIGETVKKMGLRRLKIADLFVEGDDELIISNLISAAYEYGFKEDYDVLEWVGMPKRLRKIASKHNHFTRNLPIWPLYYKVKNSCLSDICCSADSWYISLFDGDTTII